jgi:hypothetical protein
MKCLLYLQELHSSYEFWSFITILYKTVMKNILLQTGQMTPHLKILHCPDEKKKHKETF